MSSPSSSREAPAAEARPWLLALVPVIMLAMFIVPFTLLRDVNAWYGAALFWVLGTVAVILINVVLTRDWKD